jgi:hypothetical protein
MDILNAVQLVTIFISRSPQESLSTANATTICSIGSGGLHLALFCRTARTKEIRHKWRSKLEPLTPRIANATPPTNAILSSHTQITKNHKE